MQPESENKPESISSSNGVDGQQSETAATTVTESSVTAVPPAPTDTVSSGSPVANPMAANPVIAKKKRGKLAVLFAVVVAILLLAGGSAAAYFSVMLPSKPENVLKQAAANFLDAEKNKTVSFSGEATIDALENAETLDAVGLTGVAFDGQKGEKGAMSLGLQINTAIAKPRLELRSLEGEKNFVRLTGLNGLSELLGLSGELGELSALITQVNDQWYSVDSALLKQLPLVGDSLSQTSQTASSEDIKKLGELYEAHEFMIVQAKLADEAVNGSSAHHMKVVIDKPKLLEFVNAYKAADFKSMPITDEQLDEVVKMINDVDFQKYPIEVWIDKATKNFAQFKFDYADEQGTLGLKLTLKDYNATVKIEAPTDSKSLSGLVDSLQSLYQDAGGAGLQDLLSL